MGRPQFEAVVASAAREYMELVDLSTGINNNTAGTTVINHYAPDGFIGKVMGLYIHKNGVAGATSGTHVLEFGYPALTRASGKSNFGDTIRYVFSNWDSATVKQSPPTGQTQANVLNDLEFDKTNPFYIAIRNDANVADIQTVVIKAMIKYRQIAE